MKPQEAEFLAVNTNAALSSFEKVSENIGKILIHILCSLSLFVLVFLTNIVQTSKRNTGHCFLLDWRPHAKISQGTKLQNFPLHTAFDQVRGPARGASTLLVEISKSPLSALFCFIWASHRCQKFICLYYSCLLCLPWQGLKSAGVPVV